MKVLLPFLTLSGLLLTIHGTGSLKGHKDIHPHRRAETFAQGSFLFDIFFREACMPQGAGIFETQRMFILLYFFRVWFGNAVGGSCASKCTEVCTHDICMNDFELDEDQLVCTCYDDTDVRALCGPNAICNEEEACICLPGVTAEYGLCEKSDGEQDELPSPVVLLPSSSTTPDESLSELMGATLRLNKLFYDLSDTVLITVEFNDKVPSSSTFEVLAVTVDSGDVEPLTLQQSVDNNKLFVSSESISLETPAHGELATPGDGKLSIRPGEALHGLYSVDPDDEQLQDLPAQLYHDIGFLNRDFTVQDRVKQDIAAGNETGITGRPAGTILQNNSLPVQLSLKEVIFYAKSDSDLSAFLDRTSGVIRDSYQLEPSESGPSYDFAYLIEIQVPRTAANHLELLEEVLGEESTFGSNEEVLALVSYVLELHLTGFTVSLNPRLQYQGEPAMMTFERNAVTQTMENVGPSANCLPNDSTNPCILNVPSLWAYLLLMGADDERINVAVLDMGFARNADFRSPASGDPIECNMGASPIDCSPGSAQGSPTVGNSFFGERSWHGTGVVQTMGGVVNNGEFAAGVAGQVAVPMLYKYDLEAYVFDIGRGIRRAVDDGASIINVSGGYPCRILSNVAPDFDICTEGGRAGLCGFVTAGLASIAATVCAIPFVNIVACGPAIATATAASATCFSSIAFGNLKTPMYDAITYAANQGVPVVTIAGNRITRSTLPEVVRDLVNTDNYRTESWRIMPAMAPETIVAGAVDVATFDNSHFIGNRVDLWAPIRSTYFAPERVSDPSSTIVENTIGGTSAAAPYISGVIAAMQAINPELNPRRYAEDDEDRALIVGRIKDIITSPANSFSNSELAAFGYTNDPERRKLIDPLRCVQAAAAAYSSWRYRDFDFSGFDTTLGFSEQSGDDDSAVRSNVLSFGSEITGSIITIPHADGGTSVDEDVDWYEFTMPTGSAPFVAVVRYSTYGAGFLLFEGLSRRPVFFSGVSKQFLALPGERVVFNVYGGPVVYKMTVESPTIAKPIIDIRSPGDGADVCANEDVDLDVDVYYSYARTYDEYADIIVADIEIVWTDNGAALATGRAATVSFSEGSHTLLVTVHGFSEQIVMDAVICIDNVPEVTIATPSGDLNIEGWDDFDSTMSSWYKDVDVVALASDVEDGLLDGTSVVWTTDRTDIQDEILGTGASTTIRLYGDCVGETHYIRAEATDSDGNKSTSARRKIQVTQLC